MDPPSKQSGHKVFPITSQPRSEMCSTGSVLRGTCSRRPPLRDLPRQLAQRRLSQPQFRRQLPHRLVLCKHNGANVEGLDGPVQHNVLLLSLASNLTSGSTSARKLLPLSKERNVHECLYKTGFFSSNTFGDGQHSLFEPWYNILVERDLFTVQFPSLLPPPFQ